MMHNTLEVTLHYDHDSTCKGGRSNSKIGNNSWINASTCFVFHFLSMDAQANSLGPTQPVPSFVSSRSAHSQTLSRLDVCAKFVTTTADGRAEGMSSTPIPLGSDNHQ